MPDHQKTQDDLRTCLKRAGNDPAAQSACETAFKAAGGTVEGGKVFTTPDADGTAGTNGGKVFKIKPA
ncbi:MAG: hypothetical protein ACJ77V_02585 [Chloroflexota bacterium]|jgi:hypothetical protein